MKWISVEEKLPKKDGRYIVCVKNLTGYEPLKEEVIVAYFVYDDWIFTGWHDNAVTHWMPFPRKPKKH